MKLGYLKVLLTLVLTLSFSYITPVYADHHLEMATTTATPSTADGSGNGSGTDGSGTHRLPTLSEWGMSVFALLLIMAGAITYHRQKLFQ